MKPEKVLAKIVNGSKNIRFGEVVALLESLGFYLSRTNGSHHIYLHPNVSELVNVQDVRGEVKPYQIRQILVLIEKYDLRIGAE